MLSRFISSCWLPLRARQFLEQQHCQQTSLCWATCYKKTGIHCDKGGSHKNEQTKFNIFLFTCMRLENIFGSPHVHVVLFRGFKHPGKRRRKARKLPFSNVGWYVARFWLRLAQKPAATKLRDNVSYTIHNKILCIFLLEAHFFIEMKDECLLF